ncbi:MAG: DUF4367 domain-containing protein [Clostridia bacterium]|nr:DUF4367 domain-containing protein [Clostridia bacterium]
MNHNSAVLLKRAIIEGVSERYDIELAQSKENVASSQAHYQKMSEILGFDARKSQKQHNHKIIAAAIILAATLAIGSLTVYAYREQIREFFIRVYEEYIVLEFKGEQVQGGVSEHYQVGYVPEGYTLKKEERSGMHTKYEWQNAEGHILYFEQMSLNVEFRYNNEQGEAIVVGQNGFQIFCVQYKDAISYTWNDGKYAMHIYDDSMLALEEILKMIDSITE